MPDDTMGDLARQDLYPDERLMQPPVNPVDLPPEAYASLGGGDLGLLGSKGVAGLFGVPSWLQKAQDLTQKDVANYQSGGVPAVIGSLADTSDAQDLAGGFGGNIKGVKAPVVPGALAAMTDYHPPFYSAVERAVQDAKQNTAPGQQWAGYLRNQPGVKPEEVETLGLGKLFEQPTVSKDALLGEIAANKVNVGEVVKGAPHYSQEMQDFLTTQQNSNVAPRPAPTTPDQWQALSDRLMWMGQNRQPLGDTAGAQRFFSLSEEAGRYAEGVNPSTGSTAGMPKFSQWTLPGGENYREMLLTLPESKGPSGGGIRGSVERYEADKQNFRSSHYDEPNILAHVRYNDRVIDGKKTLFVEEVQSDWHQKGKREGYQSRQQTEADMKLSDSGNLADGRKKWTFTDANGQTVGTFIADTEQSARSQAFERVRSSPYGLSLTTGGVPDAPFKTTWPDLAMKRIIREAAEKGYDKVAWTPGSVQADRYDLSKQVDSINVTTRSDARTGNPAGRSAFIKLPDGHALTTGVGEDGIIDNVGASNRDWKGKRLEDVIGKEMAEKVMKAKNGDTFAGEDLKIGGEGMKGFYDQILPAAVNRLVKKHGARVEQGYIGTADVSKKAYPVSDNTGYWVGDGNDRRGPYSNWVAAQAAADKINSTRTVQAPVHTLDITPSLRAAAMKGFPLFTAGGIAATGMMGDLAKQDDYQ